MATNTSTVPALLRPDQIEALLVLPVLAASVAALTCRVARTGSHQYRIPRVTADPSAAWVSEGAEIPVSDLDADEMVVTPRKLAGLTVITNELAQDSSPDAAETVGQGLARDCARKIDQAFMGDLALPAPAGLGSLTNVTEIAAPTAYADLDPFAAAAAAAETEGATIGSWIAHPNDALSLSNLKAGSGSNVPLLALDPAQPSRRLVEGSPLRITPYATEGQVWGIPVGLAVLVLRKDVDVVADTSPFFTSDRTAVRATMRLAFGFPNEPAVVRVTRAAA